MRILFVCTGNTCRSPMAQALLGSLAEKRGLGVTSDSAGIFATPDAPFSETAREVLEQEFQITDFDHRAKQVTGEMLSRADLVIAMTDSHRLLLMQTLGERDNVIAMPQDVGDPYGGDHRVYTRCAQKILEGLESLVERGVIHD